MKCPCCNKPFILDDKLVAVQTRRIVKVLSVVRYSGREKVDSFGR